MLGGNVEATRKSVRKNHLGEKPRSEDGQGLSRRRNRESMSGGWVEYGTSVSEKEKSKTLAKQVDRVFITKYRRSQKNSDRLP